MSTIGGSHPAGKGISCAGRRSGSHIHSSAEVICVAVSRHIGDRGIAACVCVIGDFTFHGQSAGLPLHIAEGAGGIFVIHNGAADCIV